MDIDELTNKLITELNLDKANPKYRDTILRYFLLICYGEDAADWDVTIGDGLEDIDDDSKE